MTTKIPVLIQLVEHVQCNNQGYFHNNNAGTQFPLCPAPVCMQCVWRNSNSYQYTSKKIALQALKDE